MKEFIRRPKKRSYDLQGAFSYFTPGIKEIGFIILFFILGYVLATLVGIVMMKISPDMFNVYGQLVVYPLLFIPAMIYASVKSRSNQGFDEPCHPLDTNNFGSLGGFWAAVLSFIGVLALGFGLDPLNIILPEMSEAMKQALDMLMGGPVWVALLATAVFAPVCEEWLCRGMILRGLLNKTKMKPVWAILIQAAVFAAIHGNIWQGAAALLIGAFFGYIYYKTGSLKLTMFMHCINNAVAVLISRSAIGDYESYYEAMNDKPLYWILVVTMLVITGLVCVKFSEIGKAKAAPDGIDAQ